MMGAATPCALPLRIDEVPVRPYAGVIGICLCPGHSGRPDLIDRDCLPTWRPFKDGGLTRL